MAAVLAYLLLVVIFVLTVLAVNYLFSIRFSWKIPSAPHFVPFLGHLLMFVGKTSDQIFWSINTIFNTTERLTKCLIGPVLMIQVHHPDLLQKVLTNHDLHDKPFFYDFLKLGRGLISDRSGLSWKQTRKAVNPSFNMKILGGFIPMFDSLASKMISGLEPLADGVSDVDIMQHAAQCTLRMVFSTTLGSKLDERPHDKDYIENLERIQTSMGKRVMNAEMFLEPLYMLTSAYRQEMKARKFCNDFTDKIIDERRIFNAKENKTNTSKENLDSVDQPLKSNIFLDEVLNLKRNGKPFTDEEVGEQIYTMMVAGNETSAQTVSYACLFLAQNPELQEKVVAEMREVFHSPSVEMNVDSLRQLQYTEMVLKETLRLTPIVPLVARENGVEIVLDGVRIPKGQILSISFFNLHRRKDFWGEDPERFDPERFQPDAVRDRHPYAYLPFSGGFRNCIGARYAMISVKVMLTRLLMAFEVSTNIRREDMRYKFEISLRLVGPHTVQLTRRNSNECDKPAK